MQRLEENKTYKRRDGQLTSKLIRTTTGLFWCSDFEELYMPNGKQAKSVKTLHPTQTEFVESDEDSEADLLFGRPKQSGKFIISDKARNFKDLCFCDICTKMRDEMLQGIEPEIVTMIKDVIGILLEQNPEIPAPPDNDTFFIEASSSHFMFFNFLIDKCRAENIDLPEYVLDYIQKLADDYLDDEDDDFGDFDEFADKIRNKIYDSRDKVTDLSNTYSEKIEDLMTHNIEELIDLGYMIVGRLLVQKNIMLIFSNYMEELPKSAIVAIIVGLEQLLETIDVHSDKENPKKILFYVKPV